MSVKLTRGKGLRALGTALPAAARAALKKGGLASAQLVTDWAAIVGPEMARHSEPRRLSFAPGERRNGTLTIAVGGGLALELQHMEPLVLERVNAHFGYRAIERLRFIQDPPSPHAGAQPTPRRGQAGTKPAPGAADAVGDDALRAALQSLAAAMTERAEKSR